MQNLKIRIFALLFMMVLLFASFPLLTSAAKDKTVVVGEGKTEVTAEDARNYRDAESIRIADGVTRIADDAFNNFFDLTTVQLPDSLRVIGDNAFSHCSNLTTVQLPDHLQTIGQEAFYACGRLTSIRIPEEVTSIGMGAFDLTGLKTLFFDAINCADPADTSTYRRMFSFSIEGATVQIGEQVTRIPANFADGFELTTLTIPENVTEIGPLAFINCYNLEEVIFENPDTKIANNSFPNDTKLIGHNQWLNIFGFSSTAEMLLALCICLVIYLAQGVLLTVLNLRLVRRRFAQGGDTPGILLVFAALSPWLLLGLFCWMVLTVTKPPMTGLPPSFHLGDPSADTDVPPAATAGR